MNDSVLLKELTENATLKITDHSVEKYIYNIKMIENQVI